MCGDGDRIDAIERRTETLAGKSNGLRCRALLATVATSPSSRANTDGQLCNRDNCPAIGRESRSHRTADEAPQSFLKSFRRRRTMTASGERHRLRCHQGWNPCRTNASVRPCCSGLLTPMGTPWALVWAQEASTSAFRSHGGPPSPWLRFPCSRQM